MTTIAWRAPFLASDTAATFGSVIVRDDGVSKIAAVPKGLAAACGYAAYCANFLKWAASGEPGEPPAADSDDDGFLVRSDGLLVFFDRRGSFSGRPPYYAIGSGNAFAFGAMSVGATAEQAVRAAIEHDPNTGGDVTVLKLETAP